MKRLEWRDQRFVETTAADGQVLRIENDVDVSAEPPVLDGVDVVIISFPAFKDGRGFTQASALRRMGFDGDIRAEGGLFLDQLAMAVRCGFTSFNIEQDVSADAAQTIVDRYGVFYQRAHIGVPVWELRS